MSRLGRGVMAALVSALAVTSGIAGWLLFDSTSGNIPGPYSDRGAIVVVTDDPSAVVEIHQDVTLDSTYPPNPDRLLALDVVIRRNMDTAFTWAIVASGGARLACGSNEKCLGVDTSGSALPRGGRRGPGDIWIQGDVKTAFYVRNANLTLASDVSDRRSVLDAGGSVYVGTATGSAVTIELTGPTLGLLWYLSGDHLRTNLPALGATEYLRGSKRVSDLRLFVGQEGRASIPEATLALTEEPEWSLPTSQTIELSLGSGRPPPAWRLSDFQPAPRSTRDWVWTGSGTLEIDASIEDQDRIIQNQRRQFAAGALVGVAGGFIVWSLEMVVHELTRKRI